MVTQQIIDRGRFYFERFRRQNKSFFFFFFFFLKLLDTHYFCVCACCLAKIIPCGITGGPSRNMT